MLVVQAASPPAPSRDIRKRGRKGGWGGVCVRSRRCASHHQCCDIEVSTYSNAVPDTPPLFRGVGGHHQLPAGHFQAAQPPPGRCTARLGLPRPASLFPSCRHRQLYCLVGKVVLTSSLEVRVLSWLPSLQQGSGRTFSHISGCPAGVAVSSGYLLVICCVAEVSFDVDVMIDRL